MEPPNDTTEEFAGVDGDTATSTESAGEAGDETSGFIFGNDLQSEESDDTLPEREQERVVDLVRLQPTKNAELQDQWGLASGSEVHQYLESQLKEYYYRDGDGYIRATDTADEFVQNHQNVYQDVTEPDNTPEEAPDLRRRDLVIALVTLTQELGHVLSADEINEHGEYRHQRYREEFGDLFNAYQAAGILPDDVTRTDFYGEKPAEPSQSDESEDEPTSKPETPSEAEQDPKYEDEAEAEENTSEDPATSDQTEPSRQELLDEIKGLDASLDRIPYESDIDQDGRFTAYTYRNRFGSWDEALEAAGIDKEAVLLEDMQQVADTVDGDLTQPAMNEHGKYSASMAARFFGSWSDAKERLEELEASEGEEDTSAAEPVEINASSVDRPSFDVPDDVDDADLLEEIQRFADLIDEPPTEELVGAYGRYPAEEYRAAFGSWGAALETAGCAPDNLPDWTRRKYSNVDVLDGLRTAADELGHAPTTTEAGELIDFSPGLASLRFGSWSDALETAGLDPSERLSVQDQQTGEEEEMEAGEPGNEPDDEDDGKAADDDPIGSVIDDALEDMLLSDDDDDGPL
jgi:hypothetical protein